MELLLSRGADIDANSTLSETPFISAAAEGNTRIEEFLLAEGANPERPSVGANSEEAGNMDAAGEQVPSAAAHRADEDAPIDEVTVYAPRPKNFRVPMPTISQVYDDRRRGSFYYRIGRFKDAFPYLLNAAKHGFKYCQARVGYLYLTGLGNVPQDNKAAIGWLGVAASPMTMPEIKHYWHDMREQIPDVLKPEAEEIVSNYIAQYGGDTNRMNCRRHRPAGSHIKILNCTFEDEFEYSGARDALSDTSFNPIAIGTGPN